jgi:hypothetical protein
MKGLDVSAHATMVHNQLKLIDEINRFAGASKLDNDVEYNPDALFVSDRSVVPRPDSYERNPWFQDSSRVRTFLDQTLRDSEVRPAGRVSRVGTTLQHLLIFFINMLN